MSTPRSSLRRPPLRLVPLEDRCVPANIVVTVPGEDANPGDAHVSLREALAVAASDGQADTITFAPGITTVLITGSTDLVVGGGGPGDATVIDGGGRVTLDRGGAGRVLTVDGGSVTLRGLTITGGRVAGFGGGIYVLDWADATLDHVTVRGNSTIGGANPCDGGGVFSGGVLRLIDSAVLDNTAAGDAGGVGSAGQLFLTGSTVAGNTSAGSGGGVAAFGASSPGAKFVAVNSTISDNAATDPTGFAFCLGGGIYTAVPTTLTNVTVTANTVNAGFGDLGGGIALVGTAVLTMNNTIVAGNSGNGKDNEIAGPGTIDPKGGHNIVGGDPVLDKLADNGGATPTHALLPGSPAVDAGDDALAVDADGNPLKTDQRGFYRPAGGGVDVGAYEYQPPAGDVTACGCGAGGLPKVNVYNASGGLVASFLAYDPSFAGGVSVAVADVNGDGVADIITGAGAGGAPHVKVFDGTKLSQMAADGELSDAALLASFYAFDPSFAGGVNVAAGDVTGDGMADVVTGAGAGGGPHVKVFDIAGKSEVASFFAYAAGFRGGVNVAAGDVTGDGRADVVTGAGAGGAPHVEAFDGAGLAEGKLADPVKSFYAYDKSFAGGVSVAVGDVTGAGHADIVTGAGAGGAPHVKAFDGDTLAEVASFYAYDPKFGGGVDVATVRSGADGAMAIVTGAGRGGAPDVKEFDAAGPTLKSSMTAFDPGFLGGVFVG